MSVQSAQRLQEPNFATSHKNNLNNSMEPHSVQPNPQKSAAHQQWVAAFIDGQYFLTDPQSMNRLKVIEAEIQQQKKKLAKLQGDNHMEKSFYSMQLDKLEKVSNKSFCGTQFNEHVQISKKEIAQNQLQKEEDKYKENIKKMEKERLDMKKGMKLVEKHQATQEKELSRQLESKNAEPSKSEQKQSVRGEGVYIQKSRNTPKKSIRDQSKEKSFHKSRIEQSIKDNLQLNENHLQIPGNQKKDHKNSQIQKSMKSRKSVQKSVKPEIVSSQNKNSANPDSNFIQNKSVAKKAVKNDEPKSQIDEKGTSAKQNSNKKQQKAEKEKKQLSKIGDQAQLINNQLNKSNINQKASIKPSVNAESSKNKNSQHQPKKTNQQQTYEVHVIRANSINSSQIQQYSSEVKAIKSVHSHVIQGNKSKHPQAFTNKDQQLKSKKSHIHPSEKASMKEPQPAQKSHKEKLSGQELKNVNTAIKDQTNSKHSHLKQSQVKNNQPVLVKQDDIKSKRSQAVDLVTSQIPDETKSKRSYYQGFQAKSNKKEQFEQIKGKRSSVKPSQAEEFLYIPKDKSSYNKDQDLKSKKSSKIQEKQISVRKSSRAKSIKQTQKELLDRKKPNDLQQAKSQKSQLKNDKLKDVEAKAEQKNEMVNKSIQYSRMTQNKQSQLNQIKFNNGSVKNGSQIPLNQSSINQSSHIQMLNNQLTEQQVQNMGEPNYDEAKMFKKKQSQIIEKQSEKKSRSFIIHSRNGSVKQRSQKNYVGSRHNKLSEKKRQLEISSNNGESVTKQEIGKLYEHIANLRQKLQIIQHKQEQMQKVQRTFSKINSNQIQQPIQIKEIEIESPTIKQHIETLNQLVTAAKPESKLGIQSSIIQVNTQEDLLKKMQMQTEINEKAKLSQEISRLKKIIRDMQIEKIKSIDHDNELGQSALFKKESKYLDQKDSRVQKQSKIQKQSINSLEGMPTKKNFWSKSRQEEAGKIIKNSSQIDTNINEISPRRLTHRIRNLPNDDQTFLEPQELPFQSNNKKRSSNLVKDAHKHSLIQRIHDKERDFHHFVQSSRVFAQQAKNQPNEGQNQMTGFQKFAKIQAGNTNRENSNKINYSRLVEEFRKNNPEEEEVLPEIHMRDIKIPQLPKSPSAEMSQEELLVLAKQLYKIFGINIDQEDRQLCVKKYKNCVVFTVSNSSDCVLWHFSGKFYMGGWKTGEPGEGQKNGEGLQIMPEKHLYQGQFLNGKKNGTGIIKLINGNIYDGQWIDGAKNGRGVYFDAATKVLYSGEWRDGKKDGQGFLKLSEKEYYYGTFIKSVKEGFGSQIFINGDRYKGEYKNGKFHGKGKYVWANGSCYEGQFVQGARHGQGSWKSAKSNGDIYIGTYQTDKKNGYGRYVWANGCMFQGGFANDVKHGKGRLTYQDGKEIKGIWEEGNLVNTENEKKQVDHQDQPLRRSVKANTFGYHPATSHRF